MRGATPSFLLYHTFYTISIHTPHAGSDPCFFLPVPQWHISIHTPHAGSDLHFLSAPQHPAYFNPHSPCGERPRLFLIVPVLFQFQSTLPMRGATVYSDTTHRSSIEFQSTLPMRGATSKAIQRQWKSQISIHTPHAGSD